jgi:hypothetical protein
MLVKSQNESAMFRIIIAPLVWVLLAFCATGLVVAMLYRAAAIEGKIPVGLVLLGIAVGGISIPINLAIHGLVLEQIFRVKRKRTIATGLSFVLLAVVSTAIGLSLVDFWRDHHNRMQLFFAIPIPIASIATYWLHCILMPKRMS